jgi:hypothetical protein
MSLELIKEVVAFVSAIISFATALSNGQTLQRAGVPIDPLKWGALCFVLGAAFVAALFLLLSQQSVFPIASDPIIQWGGLFGFLGAVLGLISAVLVKKEARQAVAEVAAADQSGVIRQNVVYRYPEIIYVRNPHPPVNVEAMFITAIICGSVVLVFFMIFMYLLRH